MIKSICLTAGIMLSACGYSLAADVDKSLHGTWKGKSAESCLAVKNATTEEFMIISNGKIELYEGTCLIRKSTKKGKVHTVSGFCESEGMIQQLTLRLQLDGKNRLIVDGKHKYDRCK